MLGEVASAILKQRKWAAQSKFEVLLRSGEIRKSSSMNVLYFCHIPKIKDVSAARRDTVRQHLCVLCHSKRDHSFVGRKGSKFVVPELIEMQREVTKMHDKAASLAGRERSRRRQKCRRDSSFSIPAATAVASVVSGRDLRR